MTDRSIKVNYLDRLPTNQPGWTILASLEDVEGITRSLRFPAFAQLTGHDTASASWRLS
jgi:hypothetical protein